MKIHERLRRSRERRGLSKAELARRIGCTRERVGQIENGARPGLRIALALEREFPTIKARSWN